MDAFADEKKALITPDKAMQIAIWRAVWGEKACKASPVLESFWPPRNVLFNNSSMPPFEMQPVVARKERSGFRVIGAKLIMRPRNTLRFFRATRFVCRRFCA